MKIRVVKTRRRPPWPLWAVGVVFAWLALVGVLVILMRILEVDVRVCVFHRLTSWPCPSCGLTRGVLSILGGDLVAGWRFNPLMFTLLAIALADTLGRVALARKVELNLTRRQRRIAWAVFVALVLINWAYLICYVG